jgi:hypothetical protein
MTRCPCLWLFLNVDDDLLCLARVLYHLTSTARLAHKLHRSLARSCCRLRQGEGGAFRN